uniref:uncharacterized protein C6orf132 homolog isoform X2 n=1 Tax=Jaculus jaculus TaxID=51337 RepID=UPI001E1B0518|nr:uncharacterized protein C6orf132 homolog isoform X2 [Jaculus jaculus]
MKKNQTVQGTFSKLFGKKHATSATTSLYATNPPWIFTQEAPEEGTRAFDGIYYGDSRFDTVSESGTATLKARPRVRPLLTFLPLNAQENHGLAVPTPSVPEDFADKDLTGTSSLVNGNLRLYSSVGDLRPGHYGSEPPIPPPPPGPAPGPPQDASPPPGESPPPPPPSTAPPPPPLLLEPPPPPPPSTAPPPPPVLDTLSPSSALSPPSTPTPPDFIPPAPPSAFLNPPPPTLPAPAPPAPVSPHTMGMRVFPPAGVTKWKSEVTLNGRPTEAPRKSPPRSPAELKGSPTGPNPEPHLTFPRSFKVPPPAPVRTSSIPVQEAQGDPPEEEGTIRKAPGRLPLPPSFHIRPASQVYPDKAPEPKDPRELSTEAPGSPKLRQQSQTNGQAGTPPPAPPLPPPAPPLPPPAPPLPPAPPGPSAEQAAPPSAGLMKTPKSSSPALKPKPNPPSPEDTASSEPVDWRDPRQMEKLRSELAAYLCGTKRDDRSGSHRAGPIPTVALKDKEDKKGPSLPEKAAPLSPPEEMPLRAPEEGPCHTSAPEPEATGSLTLPPVDYISQNAPAPSVRQIRNELEARFSSSSEKEAKPNLPSLPPKPRLEGGKVLENGTHNGKFPKPVDTALLPATPLQSKATAGPATPPKTTHGQATLPKATPPKDTSGQITPPKTIPGQITPPKTIPGQNTLPKAIPDQITPPKAIPEQATPPKTIPGQITPPKVSPGQATPPQAMPGQITPPKVSLGQTTPEQITPPKDKPALATALRATPALTTPSSQLVAENHQQGRQPEKLESQESAASSQLEAEGPSSEATRPPTGRPRPPSPPALPPKTSPIREEVPFLYKPHRNQNSPSREIAVVMPTLARAEAAGSVEAKEPQSLPAKPLTPAQPADPLLRHPVTGEVVERGSPMALLLAARQRAQKARPGGIALGRSSLPGSLRGHSNQPEASSDSIFYNSGRPNSFLVVPKVPGEAERDSQLTSARSTGSSPWKPRSARDAEGQEPRHRHKWTNAESPARVAWERPSPSSLPQGRALPKSFSSPPSPSHKRKEEEVEEVAVDLGFEIIPPPPEFSNDPEPPAPALQYASRRGSPPRNGGADPGRPLDARGLWRFPGAHGPAAGSLGGRWAGGGRSLIKKRLYVGDPPRGAGGRGLSTPNCFGPPQAPGAPERRRVHSAGRAAPGGPHARRRSLESGGARGPAEAKFKAPGGGGGGPGGGDYGFTPATGRSPRGPAHYGSPINTFTVRPGTRHPISYAYSGAHRKATS